MTQTPKSETVRSAVRCPATGWGRSTGERARAGGLATDASKVVNRWMKRSLFRLERELQHRSGLKESRPSAPLSWCVKSPPSKSVTLDLSNGLSSHCGSQAANWSIAADARSTESAAHTCESLSSAARWTACFHCSNLQKKGQPDRHSERSLCKLVHRLMVSWFSLCGSTTVCRREGCELCVEITPCVSSFAP